MTTTSSPAPMGAQARGAGRPALTPSDAAWIRDHVIPAAIHRTAELPAGLPLVNANRRVHWRVRHERAKAIRQAAFLLTRGKVPPLARAHVTGETYGASREPAV